ncbi:DUF3795 domain-containing protein [Acetobacterium wieringae]|uniref:DUF3795 domain-containing protein n=1 Tax=Acetobacterium wieringae TaxID=52694 RepID=UPI0026EF3B1A|nr:DUF3795 domain-containing protein [Acetobacterium wieringae]
MQDRITLCGDNCTYCPRFNAHTQEELKQVAELWYHLGWRDRVVSPDEIKCPGCNPNKQCPYGLIDCTWEHEVRHCNQCVEYPCQKIERMLRKSREFKTMCQEICSDQEYAVLKKAFFEKHINLGKKDIDSGSGK